jgi:molybdenum cofactor cytidylyltransferase
VVAAIVLAAGQSRRMGAFKQLLPLGDKPVVAWVITALVGAGITEIIVVTGHRRQEVEAVLSSHPVRCVANPDYAAGEMLSSIQVGLRALGEEIGAALLVLGDQPQLQSGVIRTVLQSYRQCDGQHITIPTYAGRRGHPICIPRAMWSEVLALPLSASLRDVLRKHANEVREVPVDTDSILRDMDTWEDYQKEERDWSVTDADHLS